MIYLQKCFKSDNYGNILDFVIDLQKGFYDNYDNILIFVIDLQKCFYDNYDNVLIFVIDLLIRTMLFS